MNAYLVHGFNVSDHGAGSIDTMAPYFEEAGLTIKQVDYRRALLARVRLCSKAEAQMLAGLVEPGSVGIGHSHGCALLHMACEFGAPFKELIYINPALNKNALRAPQVEWRHVWHSPSDVPVRAAALLFKHIWGKMGAVGYQGPQDDFTINYDKENDYDISSDEHSDVFQGAKRKFFGPEIRSQARTF